MTTTDEERALEDRMRLWHRDFLERDATDAARRLRPFAERVGMLTPAVKMDADAVPTPRTEDEKQAGREFYLKAVVKAESLARRDSWSQHWLREASLRGGLLVAQDDVVEDDGPSLAEIERRARRCLTRPVVANDAPCLLICVVAESGRGYTQAAALARLVSPHCELYTVTLSGRQHRANESGEYSVARHAAEAVEAVDMLLESDTRPYMVLGHYIGALVAFEVCIDRERRGLRPPFSLVVSGMAPPSLFDGLTGPDPHDGGPPLSQRTNSEILDYWFKERNNLQKDIPPWVLQRAASLHKADAKMLERHEDDPTRSEVLSCPVTAVAGDTDVSVTDVLLSDWERCTKNRRRFKIARLPGGASYLLEPRGRASLARLVRLAADSPTRDEGYASDEEDEQIFDDPSRGLANRIREQTHGKSLEDAGPFGLEIAATSSEDSSSKVVALGGHPPAD